MDPSNDTPHSAHSPAPGKPELDGSLAASPTAQPDASRRSFLRRMSALAAGGTASAFASGVVLPSQASAKSAKSAKSASAPGGYNQRRAAAKKVRHQSTNIQDMIKDPVNRANSDEKTLGGFISCYTKALPHDAFGEIDPVAYQKLLKALENKSASAWEEIPLGGVRKQANPQASLAFTLLGGDSHSFFLPPAPAFSSAEEASEMAEVYLHALTRDVPFDEYGTDPVAAFAVNELNAFSDFRGPKIAGVVTPKTLFRGSFAGDLAGNYISQFLLKDIPAGPAVYPQRYRTTVPGDDHMITEADWLNSQRGGAPTTANTFDPAPRYITTERDLGAYVHADYSYQAFLNAALILLGAGVPLNVNNPYRTSVTQGAFVTFGGPDILSLVAQAAVEGLKAAWYQKWQVHRRLRPEVFAGRVHFRKTGAKTYPAHPELLNSPVLDAIALNFGGGYWLPMAYPEGSPTHPAYPAGHATIAGACTTVLKALFNGSVAMPSPMEVVPGSNGAALQAYSGADPLTVNGELNKLANNIAIGRDIAGVHWRTDGTEGVLLGEDVAVRLLRDAKLCYNETYSDYTFTGFRGNTIAI